MGGDDVTEESAAFRAAVRCELPPLTADLEVPPATTLGVIGPNGAGKSTLLGVLAGLRRTPGSEVWLGERVLQGRGVFVEPHRRSVVLLEQKAKLFPHLDVRRNVAFGPAAAGLSRRAARARAEHWLEAVGVAHLADRMPSQLSGGQAQRAAIARALATEPSVLLLDEPFAALDVDVAQQMRTLVRSLLSERAGCTVLVTHDLVDIVGLADTVAVLDHGRLVQTGPTTEVLTHPETSFAASLSGVNLVTGRFAGSSTIEGPQGITVVGEPSEPLTAGQAAAAAFSPRAVAVYPQAPHGSPRNSWTGTVTEVMPRGDHAVVWSDCGGVRIGAEVTWESVAELGLGHGSPVFLVVKATEVRIYGTVGPASVFSDPAESDRL
ncbi:ATP-binding cassette domain-containing protein [Gordonia desulfuricans]|uniref:ATP-binding cassette domain-containing protein n=1 Tax=Gordonia desulfuricans TaxID=89051 RepID=A0A7K3LLF6_9ACTN|nr:ATP-binding cassette domain-containing protein [Gordonia desulfuricans]